MKTIRDRTIKVVFEMNAEDFENFIEEMGGSYDEDCLWEDINGMLDELPVCCTVRGYNVEEGEYEYDDKDE
jgi:hypothetical protein